VATPLQAIDELAVKQRAILSAAAPLVKPGGRLVYATCSILREENDAVADAFLTAHRNSAAFLRDAARGPAHRARYRRATAALAAFTRHRRLFRRGFRARGVNVCAPGGSVPRARADAHHDRAVTIYLHRCQAHRALELHPVVSHFFRFWLWLTTGMVTKEWAAIHRKHHAKCETEEDPHSPQIHGINKVLWRACSCT
jgi:hypothetical protein